MKKVNVKLSEFNGGWGQLVIGNKSIGLTYTEDNQVAQIINHLTKGLNYNPEVLWVDCESSGTLLVTHFAQTSIFEEGKVVESIPTVDILQELIPKVEKDIKKWALFDVSIMTDQWGEYQTLEDKLMFDENKRVLKASIKDAKRAIKEELELLQELSDLQKK